MLSKGMLSVLAVGLGVSTALAQTDNSSVFYRLTAESAWQEGCFAPCVCPVSEPLPMMGTFRLVALSATASFDTYAVTDIRWSVTSGNQRLGLTGAGVYCVGRAGEAVQQLQLDLQTDGGVLQHYDSGLVPGGSGFPLIDVTVSINGVYCADTVIHIVSKPATRATVYRLGKGGAWQQGCFGACECATGDATAITGTFLLERQDSGVSCDTYAVTDVDWLVRTPDGPRRMTGSGTYQIGGEGVVTQRLQLDLRTDAGPVEHFDSGDVAAGGGFPAIDVVIGINPPVCLDTVVHVLAKPAGDFDLNGLVDETDFAWFQACLTGPDRVHPDPACQAADLDDDGDVDQADFAIFQRCITGPGEWMDAACVR